MEGSAAEAAVEAIDFSRLIIIVNAGIVSTALMAAGLALRRGSLTEGVPDGRQNFGEFVLDFFVGKAREMSHGHDRAKVVGIVAPLLATFFLFIFISNLFMVLPLPKLNRPPTAHFSVTLALGIASVLATIGLGMVFQGVKGGLKHLVWPNPLEFIAKITDVFSLALRLFGNIGGEYMTLVLVTGVVALGIPLIMHVLGFIPAFVQALVFTLLTASFTASALHKEEKKEKKKRTRRRGLRRSKELAPEASVATAEGGS
ncbi:MAG: F0F1 ATP synthase subunit A [Coriobacteriia bacterium]|nr:F0F1 ATP synthase subunit A [Coriobacteriia bacterium]